MSASPCACDACLRRAWLLGRLGGHLETARAGIWPLLALPDEELIEAVAGRRRTELRDRFARFEAGEARRLCLETGVEALCRCDERYPSGLRELDAPPAVLHVAGGLGRFLELSTLDPVAVVGARRASGYGLETSHSLGRGLAASGVAVLSGMAAGIDSAAHSGALAGGGLTVAVLPGPPDRPYPPSRRRLFESICEHGAAVSELPPGSAVRRWTFLARNRIIAALAHLTLVVEAGVRSGALVTARIARGLARPVGAVPGQVTAPLAAGPNGLIAGGATLIRDPQDALDALFGAGIRSALSDQRPTLEGDLARLLDSIAEGLEPSRAFDRVALTPDAGLAALAELELCGYVRREQGGRFTVVP